MHSNNLFVTTLKNQFLQFTTATTDYRALIKLFYDGQDTVLFKFTTASTTAVRTNKVCVRWFFLYDGCVLTELTATFNFLMCTLFVINYMNETDTLVWRNMNKWYDIYC